jgi:hypothetical protein
VSTNHGMREHCAVAQPIAFGANGAAGKHATLISRGVSEELCLVPFHDRAQAPLSRRVLSDASIHEHLQRRIVMHELRDVRAERRSYCDPHVHDFAEVNLLLSSTQLRYLVRLGDETYFVDAPASIHVPAGLVHSANVFEGSGFFIALLDTVQYSAAVAPGVRSPAG